MNASPQTKQEIWERPTNDTPPFCVLVCVIDCSADLIFCVRTRTGFFLHNGNNRQKQEECCLQQRETLKITEYILVSLLLL